MKFPFSMIAREEKKFVIDGEGRVTRSEIYFTNVETDEEVQLCMTPEKISIKTEASFRTYNIVETGEVSLPKGERLTRISWSGILPGAGMLMYPFLSATAWESPQEIIKVFKRWREDGAKIKLLITQTPVNLEVYIKDFDYDAEGGMGDYKYSIGLIAAKELQVLTVEEADAKRQREQEEAENALEQRARMKSKAGVYINTIDNIYAAVKILTGRGSLADIERVLEWSGIAGVDDVEDSGGCTIYNPPDIEAIIMH